MNLDLLTTQILEYLNNLLYKFVQTAFLIKIKISAVDFLLICNTYY